MLDKDRYDYNIDDIEDFEDFREYFGIDEKENDDDEPKELDFG